MNNHPTPLQLTAYADDALPADERGTIDLHLSTGCALCETELSDARALKVRLARMPRHDAPSTLLSRLKAEFSPPWWRRALSALTTPALIWRPAGALAIVALAVGTWIAQRDPAEDDVNLDSLVAAHARYQAESLVPTSDMVGSDFSSHLAAYYGEEK